jgi:glycosyltransferase 2 family protein
VIVPLKRFAPSLFGFVVSAVLLVFVFYSIEWSKFLSELRGANLLYVPLLVVLCIGMLLIRALRWKYLLPSNLHPSLSNLLQAAIVGFFSSAVLPLRAGEFVRPWFLSRLEPVSFSVGFASIVVERVFDVLALMLLLALCLSQISDTPPLVVAGAQALTILALCILVVMLVSYFYSSAISRFADKLIALVLRDKRPQLKEAIQRMLAEFLSGLSAISSFRELLLVVFWSLVLWLEASFFYQVALWVFGYYPSWWVGVTLNVMIALAVAAPSAPGFIGTFQLGCVVALTHIYGYPQEFSVAYSVFIHSLQLLLICIFGVGVLRKHGLKLDQLRTRKNT